jgi:SAM-dependent methyltransferase
MVNSEKYQQYYQDKSGTRVAGWKNQDAQYIRFEQLAKIIQQDAAFSINDLGCGMGHFSRYLYEIYPNFEYYGYDVLPEMIDEAKQLFGESYQTHFNVIEKAKDMHVADYSIASGIFNLRFDTNDQEWLKYITETIEVMHEKSKKGFAFNCLTAYSDSDKMEKQLYYADPLFLFDFCKKKFSKNVALLHDYNQYDFTILVRKIA